MSLDHGHMTAEDRRLKLIQERSKLAESRGFTAAYQHETEEQDNVVVCLKQRAPATEATYSRAIENWCLYSWQLSQNEPESKSFAKEEPDPSAQTLKLFAGDFVVTHKDLPSQSTVRHSISCFVVEWERKTR